MTFSSTCYPVHSTRQILSYPSVHSSSPGTGHTSTNAQCFNCMKQSKVCYCECFYHNCFSLMPSLSAHIVMTLKGRENLITECPGMSVWIRPRRLKTATRLKTVLTAFKTET